MNELYSKDYQYLLDRLKAEEIKIIDLRREYYNASDEVMVGACDEALKENTAMIEYVKKVDREMWESSEL